MIGVCARVDASGCAAVGEMVTGVPLPSWERFLETDGNASRRPPLLQNRKEFPRTHEYLRSRDTARLQSTNIPNNPPATAPMIGHAKFETTSKPSVVVEIDSWS
jgi:hypothetical protein